MSDSLSADTLRAMLDRGEPLTIVDIRSRPAFLADHIPGSLHADAGGQLMEGDTTAFEELDLQRERPVVVVCAVGSRSQLAAAYLQAMGFDAYSLEGGMQAWQHGQ